MKTTPELGTICTLRTRPLLHADANGIRICSRFGDREGTLMAQYDRFAWVLWDDAAERCGCWMPDTEARTAVWVKEA